MTEQFQQRFTASLASALDWVNLPGVASVSAPIVSGYNRSWTTAAYSIRPVERLGPSLLQILARSFANIEYVGLYVWKEDSLSHCECGYSADGKVYCWHPWNWTPPTKLSVHDEVSHVAEVYPEIHLGRNLAEAYSLLRACSRLRSVVVIGSPPRTPPDNGIGARTSYGIDEGTWASNPYPLGLRFETLVDQSENKQRVCYHVTYHGAIARTVNGTWSMARMVSSAHWFLKTK